MGRLGSILIFLVKNVFADLSIYYERNTLSLWNTFLVLKLYLHVIAIPEDSPYFITSCLLSVASHSSWEIFFSFIMLKPSVFVYVQDIIYY